MRHLCAWCQAEIRHDSAPEGADEAISHGICADCLARMERRLGMEFLDRVETLPHAALAVDGDLRIRAMNQWARSLFPEVRTSLLGHRLSEPLGCPHPQASQGDHEDPGCPGCELSLLVKQTLLTGMAGFAALASLHPGHAAPWADRAYRITTMRLGDMVALRMDPVEESSTSPHGTDASPGARRPRGEVPGGPSPRVDAGNRHRNGPGPGSRAPWIPAQHP